jgi:hypothetical protein
MKKLIDGDHDEHIDQCEAHQEVDQCERERETLAYDPSNAGQRSLT